VVPVDRIERIDILRGQAAIDRYGERGRNGVLMIVTRGSAPARALGRDTVIAFIDTTQGQRRLQLRRPDLSATGALIVLNGVVLSAEEGRRVADSIRSEDIESIEVVRGAAAARLYGDRAAYGVISIRTKRREG
jgi:TonB-dependent SusC/RagA subfamily outer membrane receptor